ncbi:TetR/AcrR family transcriptional regulator [Frankia sp. CNm7]|uniref:TetR/AcrR family transcriptional regulator n=1 Tax=Frankia nepalensis TaxID=1836974 RepID=A0A937RJP5_9ACTN|nr:TetR/AcrR family transcriptional regulator [Frankia nepalensis]MBL7500121.1 TetR/AcrR family transcriptional regulator [Frankia nepalensis]MBL7511153.1 TetR/AcrR family transcriptional regulator [Frankia nepalensis]MBL7517846.1 TetR/AcrR family transcriptional regulator [Frankia nepalensis]MBL7631565.1 TetR/AcrR family transcriptional regulator [Frankia nepalensis]
MTGGTAPRPAGGFAAATRDRLRETLLDAAADVLREQGARQARMADVASRAGVSRQTLYQHYGSRDALVRALLLRETSRFLDAVGDAVISHADDAQAAVAAAFEVFLAAVAEDTLVKSMMTGSEEFAGLLAQHGPPLLAAARQQLVTCFHQAWPDGDPADGQLVADCVVRLAMSYLTLPSDAPELTGRSVARILGPFVLSATGTAHPPAMEPADDGPLTSPGTP